MFGRTCTRIWANKGTSHSALYSTRCCLQKSQRSRLPGPLLLRAASRNQSDLGSRNTWIQSPTPFSTSTRCCIQQNSFESLGIYPPLAANLRRTMLIDTPSALQRAFIPPILEGKDVLIRDTTGSGKTFGILLALLNKPRRRVHPNNLPGITSVLIVPNQELAFQLESWTRSLFPTFSEQQMQGLIQVLVTPSTQSSPLMIPEDLLDEASSEQSTRLRQHREELSPSTTIKAPKIDHQLETLTKVLPHVLVATPTRLWNLMQSGILDLSGIETLVLDEIDHLIRLPKRFASQREIFNRDRHPRPAELALREIMRSAEVTGRRIQDKSSVTQTSGEKGVQKQGTTDTIQIIAASATMNRPMRHWLESNGWVQDPEWVDTTKSVVLPEGIEHHCVVIGPGSVRNMRPESNHIPWNERGAQSGRQEVNALSKPQQAGEIDWIEKDQAWQNEEGKDKDASWKEQQLKAPGAVALEPEGAVERFGDDDDRMLEGVAMACMLDHVENACVFFCSSFSLSHIATRLEMDFGLSVQQIQDAFVSHSDSGATSSQAVHDRTRSDRKGKGIYLAHESNARGLDLPGLSHVYIVGLPSSPSSYVHMAGRTGRMGKKGQVVTIIRDDGHLEDRARSLFRTLNVNIQPFEHVE